MQLQNKNDNAANRKSYVGSIYNIGEKAVKESVLNSLDENGLSYTAKDTFISMISMLTD